MLAEIITIGDEILIGQIIDTNSAFIAKTLNAIGIDVYQITSVQDTETHIKQALTQAKNRVDVVIITGGLGPTKDDVTKKAFCDYFEDTLVENKAVHAHIASLFKNLFKQEPLPSNFEQALVPSRAKVLHNTVGTAPGMWMEKEGTVFISMPGVPYEMKALMNNEVLPLLKKHFKRPFIYHKTLLTYGLGESKIAQRITSFETSLPPQIKLAYLPSFGRVRLRLSCKGQSQEVVMQEVNNLMDVLYTQLQDIAIGYEDDTTLEGRIGALLQQRQFTLALAESCTGGALSQQITSTPGASGYFRGSVVPYATPLKTSLLGVSESVIAAHDVVSTTVAKAMATNVKQILNTDYALATTGVAGPTQGDAQKEVGTVCIALATPETVKAYEFNFGTPRERVIKKTVNKALEILYKELTCEA